MVFGLCRETEREAQLRESMWQGEEVAAFSTALSAQASKQRGGGDFDEQELSSELLAVVRKKTKAHIQITPWIFEKNYKEVLFLLKLIRKPCFQGLFAEIKFGKNHF